MNRLHQSLARESWSSEVYRPLLKIRLILNLVSSSLFFLMMFATNGKPPVWLWFLFVAFGMSLAIWLQWKKRQAMWNAIGREIHHGIEDRNCSPEKTKPHSQEIFCLKLIGLGVVR